MRLYDYFRSTAAYRVRIALNVKGIDYESVPVNLRDGEQGGEGYAVVNPQHLVPVLEHEGRRLTQSLAICEYIDELQPSPALLPGDRAGRARVRAIAQSIACDIHPIDNLRVLKYLTGRLGVSEDDKLAWYHHWIHEGFRAIEATLADAPETGTYCHGESVTLADVCLVPQVYNANRFEVDLSAYPTIRRINDACLALAPFDRARPERQPDAPS
ncbi:maleylacetoacetate isomerase [Arhodomonas sp. AD133]|uniref:maleylacetoacetate isomerase n=1 Tax=Arhodomonas sp. AD133 TaxID=3415009 RepID=UPI003EB76B6A